MKNRIASNLCALNFDKSQAPVVQTMDSAVHRINHYPADNSIGFARVYPLDSDLSGGQRYPSFEQLGPGGVLLGVSVRYLFVALGLAFVSGLFLTLG